MPTWGPFVAWIGAATCAVALLGGISSCSRSRDQLSSEPATPGITHGVASGDVTADSAIIWARCARGDHLWVALRPQDGDTERIERVGVTPDRDWTGKVRVTGLLPDTVYAYRAWCGDSNSTTPLATTNGQFRTSPPPSARHPVRLAWGGDLAGQNVCRDRADGYLVFDALARKRPDFFVALGDMIYADDPCKAVGRYGNEQIPGPPLPALHLPDFWAYWKYNRDDAAYRRFLASTSQYAIWDDHEVVDDSGPHHDTPRAGGEGHLLPIGLAAFLDYNPVNESTTGPHRLYRNIRWGQHLEMLILDTRQYRDSNFAVDDPQHPKSMLGKTQRAWLLDRLQGSDATWKVIVSSVPLVIPTGTRARDGWTGYDQPTGFQQELLDVLRFAETHDIRNTFWISTDVHYAAVFRHTPFERKPAFVFYEVETGPLNAGVYPKKEFDRRLGTQQLFLYPHRIDPLNGFTEVKTWFNFGVADIDENGRLTIEIVTATGDVLYTLALPPEPR